MYKYIDENTVQKINEYDSVNFSHKGNELDVIKYTNEKLKEMGYKELVTSDYPQEKEFYHVVTTYQDGEVITEKHQLVKDNEPNYEELVHHFIREKYTENDEFKALRLGSFSNEWQEYNSYVNEVRRLAKEHIERWQQA